MNITLDAQLSTDVMDQDAPEVKAITTVIPDSDDECTCDFYSKDIYFECADHPMPHMKVAFAVDGRRSLEAYINRLEFFWKLYATAREHMPAVFDPSLAPDKREKLEITERMLRLYDATKKDDNEMKVERKERGWPGHYCCSYRCIFHLNTLVSYGDTKVVVSTVGLQQPVNSLGSGEYEKIGLTSYFETRAFHADSSQFEDADVSFEIGLDCPCSLPLPDMELEAGNMHENAVREIMRKIKKMKKGSE